MAIMHLLQNFKDATPKETAMRKYWRILGMFISLHIEDRLESDEYDLDI